MTGGCEAAHDAGALGMMRRVARGRAAFAAAHLHLADDVARRVEQTSDGERPDRQRRGSCIAADTTDMWRGRFRCDEAPADHRRSGRATPAPRARCHTSAGSQPPDENRRSDRRCDRQASRTDRCGLPHFHAAGTETGDPRAPTPRTARISMPFAAQVGVCEVNELTVETFAGHLPDIERAHGRAAVEAVRRRCSQTRQRWRCGDDRPCRAIPTRLRQARSRSRAARALSGQPLAVFQPLARYLQTEVHHALRNVDAGRRDAVAKLHRVVDFVDEQASVGILEQVERDETATDCTSRPGADVRELRRDRAVARRSPRPCS